VDDPSDDDAAATDDDEDADADADAFALASSDDGEAGMSGVGGGADVFRRHPPLADLDAAAPDFENRCAALARLMPRGLSSVRVTLPGPRAVAAGAPSAPRVLATLLLALRGRQGSGGGGGGGGAGSNGGGGLQHLTLHLDEDGVELFDDGEVMEEEEEEEGLDAAAAAATTPAIDPPLPPPLPSASSTQEPPTTSDHLPPLPPHLGSLRSLAVTGGALSRRSTARLLRALAAACPRLEALRLLPDRSLASPGAGGLSDADVPLVAALAAAAPLLATLEFSAAAASSIGGDGADADADADAAAAPPIRLPGGFTGAGLVALARALPSLRVLRVHRLDALAAVAAADAECFACRPALRELHLGCDAALPPEAARRLAAAAGGLSMRFRWSEPPLLKTATVGLAGSLLRLDLGVVRLPSGPAAARRFAGCLSALTRLQSLRCALTAGPAAEAAEGAVEGRGLEGEQRSDDQDDSSGNGGSGSEDDGESESDGGGGSGPSRHHHHRRRQGAAVATFNVSQLASLTDLRALEITKRAAWSVPAPQQAGRGAFVEPSLAIPLSPRGAAALAQSCGRLRALRLRLSRRDVSAEGLAALSRFSRLERLSLVVDYNSSSGGGGGGGGGSGGGGGGSLGSSPSAAAASGSLLSSSPGGSSSFLHATALVPLDLLDLPCTLTALHLRHVSICTPASALQALGAPPFLSSREAPDDEGAPPPPLPPATPTIPPLSRLSDLDLEQCRLRPAQLGALASAASPSLRRLRLAGVAGLSDEALAGLASATALRELCVEAPGNRLVTQRGLLSLGAPLARPLRRLTWRSDDLSRLGPVLGAYAAFTSLRGLSLSCTRAAAERGARLRRAQEAQAGAGAFDSTAAANPSSSFSGSGGGGGAAADSSSSPIDALRLLLPLATLELSGAVPLAPLRAPAE
jgi:hypothetical protein